jgi:hypothetical protein
MTSRTYGKVSKASKVQSNAYVSPGTLCTLLSWKPREVSDVLLTLPCEQVKEEESCRSEGGEFAFHHLDAT